MAIHVLSIGNSFSQDAHRYLHDVARSEGVVLETVNLYVGGCPLERHFRNMKGDNKEYSLEINGHNSGGFRASIKEALVARSWDYITLQQVSSSSFHEETYQPYLNELVSYIREYCPKAKILIHQTWAYESGSKRIHDLECGYETYEDMFADLKRCYAKAAADIHADGIIPSGQAFRYALGHVEKVHRDTTHASFGLGRFILALVWYKTLTGNDINNVSYNMFDEEVTEAEYKLAIEAANSACGNEVG